MHEAMTCFTAMSFPTHLCLEYTSTHAPTHLHLTTPLLPQLRLITRLTPSKQFFFPLKHTTITTIAQAKLQLSVQHSSKLEGQGTYQQTDLLTKEQAQRCFHGHNSHWLQFTQKKNKSGFGPDPFQRMTEYFHTGRFQSALKIYIQDKIIWLQSPSIWRNCTEEEEMSCIPTF